VQAAGNRTIAKFIEQTRYQLVVRQFWDFDIIHPRPESLDEHRAILVALKAGDSSAAELMMRLHVSNARDALKLGVAEAASVRAG
jgi:DNA-binding GntR family transcriptional regulator